MPWGRSRGSCSCSALNVFGRLSSRIRLFPLKFSESYRPVYGGLTRKLWKLRGAWRSIEAPQPTRMPYDCDRIRDPRHSASAKALAYRPRCGEAIMSRTVLVSQDDNLGRRITLPHALRRKRDV